MRDCGTHIRCDIVASTIYRPAKLSRCQSVSPVVFCLSSHLSVLPVRSIIRQFVCLPVCPQAPLCSYVSLSRLSACQGCYSSALPQVCLSVCLPACLPTCLSLIYLFIVLSVSLVFSVWSEARLPSFTVKCSADWKGHFSNGAALLLIFCLSLGVRLIYHASSPADIQIHFDWRLDGMTPTTTDATHTARMHEHTQSNVMFCILSQVYSGYEYAYYANTYCTRSHLDLKTCTCIHILTRKLTQTHRLSG